MDIDLGPIVRHCLHARKIALVRDVVLTFLIIVGLVLALLPTISVFVIAYGLRFFRGPAWQRRSAVTKAGIVAGIAILLVGIGVVVVISVLLSSTGGVAAPGPLSVNPARFLPELAAFLVLTAATVVVHTRVKFRTLSDRLRPGAEPTRFSLSNGQVEARLSQVEAAQWGNMTLYSGENPFVGTGKAGRAWSIAIELDRAYPTGQEFSLKPPPRRYVPVDAVELHQFIRRRLLKLNDPELPENERISALTVEDHVVGEGLRRWEGPLIDPVQKIPYSHASIEAIEALIRHPQAGLRYYQRVSVGDEGQPVHSGGREVVGGVGQDVAVSAFVYAAVEGRMFYLQFVTTVLPPIQRRYHIIDRLPTMSSQAFNAKIVMEAATTLFDDLIGAPFRVIGTLLLMMREQRSFAGEAEADADYLYGDVGVLESARELAAAAVPHTHIQSLDVEKYTKIIERLLTDSVFDFLREKGIDTTAYAASASIIVNNANVTNYGNVAGPLAANVGGPITQTTQSPSAPAASAG